MANADVRKYVPSHFLQVLGKNLPAILDAVNSANENTEALIQACIDQMFISTAQGRYLVQLGEQNGFTLPENSGLDIRAYKVLVPIMVANPKQVRITIDELIQAFYKNERTKAYIISSVAAPYSLVDGDDIAVETDSGRYSFAILSGQVNDLTSVSAGELASIINAAQEPVIAETFEDKATGLEYLRIFSKTSGTGSSIRVVGGKLQNVLQFEKLSGVNAVSGTTWNLTKPFAYSDELKFTWDGIGTNPLIYNSVIGDIVTIRGFVDGLLPYSELNGSFAAVDVGYDYFIIRNDKFDYVSASVTQNSDNNIIFTSTAKISVFDRQEYAVTSETKTNTITITVPAVPPLTRRFLKGAAHLHGSVFDVIDFSRTTIKIDRPSSADKPDPDNFIVLSNGYERYDFKRKFLKSFIVDTSVNSPEYQIETNDDGYSVLPYTVSTLIGLNSIYGEIDSDIYRINFPSYRHGLRRGWGVTLDSATGAGNILSGDLNKEHQIIDAEDEYSATIRLKDSFGDGIPFAGISWSTAGVYQHSISQTDGSDFYLDFGSQVARIASGLTAGMTFKLDPFAGTNLDPFYGVMLRYRKLVVKSVSGSYVNFSSGLGVGSAGNVISGATGFRSGSFGGSVNHRLDKTSSHNQERVLSDLKALFAGYTVSQNPAYVGSYIYDPTGSNTNFTVSKYVTSLNNIVLKGSNLTFLDVDSLDFDGEEMPTSGSLVIDYGKDQVEGPIRFFATIKNPGSSQILIDPAYKFKFTHQSGAKVQYIHEARAYTPDSNGKDYAFYLTGTTTSRESMFDLVKLLNATGIFVEKEVLLPDLRYDDLALMPFE